MAHGGRSRPDAAFKDAAHSPILVTMEPAIVTEEQRARKRPGRRAAAIQLLVMIAIGGGLAWLKITAHPPPAGAAGDYAEAQKTEGRSRLPGVPSVERGVQWVARAGHGELLYAWQTGNHLRVRVDTAPYTCPKPNWRQWWQSADRGRISIAAYGHFQNAKRKLDPISAGGIDILATWIDGELRGERLDLRFTRQDRYRTAAGDGECMRSETFIARRSG
jgi:hypothetical protein